MFHSNKNVFHYGYNSRVPIGVHICIYYQHLNRKQMLAIKMSIDINNAENYTGCNRKALEPDRSVTEFCILSFTVEYIYIFFYIYKFFFFFFGCIGSSLLCTGFL